LSSFFFFNHLIKAVERKTKICTVITIEENQLIKDGQKNIALKRREKQKSLKEIIKMHILNKRKKLIHSEEKMRAEIFYFNHS
jgi:hypothetical protein